MKISNALLVAVLCCFQAAPAFAQFGAAWKMSPSVTVIGSENDPRQIHIEKAVAFWNRTLEEQGTNFRIGRILKLQDSVPDTELAALSNAVVGRTGIKVVVPDALTTPNGDILIYLGGAAFVSFVSPFSDNGKRVVGIRNIYGPPMNMPNVALNVITHELGHALGIGHNTDETTLMCGRPASCRPDAFFSTQEKLFPLSALENTQIQTMYPATWKAQP